MQATHEVPGPWQEPVRGSTGNPALLMLPGMEQLRSLLASKNAPPISRLTGLRLTSVGAGTCTFVMPASEWFLGPKGRIHTGMLAFLADEPLALAILSALPARTLMTTVELSMTLLGEPPSAGGNLLAQARLIHSDEGSGLSEVFITDADGRLAAHGTSRCTIFPPVALSGESISEPAPEPAYDTPDPYERPIPGGAGDIAPAGLSGLDVLRAAIRGDVPLPPIDHLTGIHPTEADDGRVVFEMPASGWLMSPTGTIYGGIIACLAKSAASGAVQTIAPAGTGFTALDVKVNYLKPGVVGGGTFVAKGSVIHRGRRLAIATAEVAQNGKLVAVATGSTALRPPAAP